MCKFKQPCTIAYSRRGMNGSNNKYPAFDSLHIFPFFCTVFSQAVIGGLPPNGNERQLSLHRLLAIEHAIP